MFSFLLWCCNCLLMKTIGTIMHLFLLKLQKYCRKTYLMKIIDLLNRLLQKLFSSTSSIIYVLLQVPSSLPRIYAVTIWIRYLRNYTYNLLQSSTRSSLLYKHLFKRCEVKESCYPFFIADSIHFNLVLIYEYVNNLRRAPNYTLDKFTILVR